MHKILLGDCLDVLKTMPENSVDSIVTDPPYGLSFMGKEWDYDVPSVEIWKECLRVLKPGGYLLSFAGTRTQHRMACNIEDAGFEIRDMIGWIYGSGFPKSLNIGKAIDKLQGNKREEYIHKYASRRVNNINSNASHEYGFDTTKKTDTKGTSPFEGWGTALKPALEPVTVARKPLSEKTVAENCLKWGTGGINIDGCRVETEDNLTGGQYSGKEREDANCYGKHKNLNPEQYHQPMGRFPANIIHDGSEEVLECFPETGGGKFSKGCIRTSKESIYELGFKKKEEQLANAPDNYGDSGSASRFFKECNFIKENLCNANFAKKSLSPQKKVEDFVLSLVAIEGHQEDNPLKNLIQPFMREIQKQLNNVSMKNMKEIQTSGEGCLQELKLTVTGKLSSNPVRFAEIQEQINTMMIIQSLLNIDGFVDLVMSNAMLCNMVLGAKGYESRFNYCAKASKKDRDEGCGEMEKKHFQMRPFADEGCDQSVLKNRMNSKVGRNNHPTVKPTSLMQYLCRLVTPKGGIILDPFCGSGSTGKGAVIEGFNFIGIEREAEYVKIANARIASVAEQTSLFGGA